MGSAGNEGAPDAERESAHLRLLKALADPVRLQLLGVLSYRDVSPAEFARMQSEPLADVLPHFRTLEELNCIELAETRKVDGATEHIYRRTQRVVFDDDSWLLMPDEARQVIVSTTVRDLVGQMSRALQAGTFTTREDMHVSWQSIRVDEAGWKQLAAILEGALSEVEKVEEEAAERLAEADQPGIIATVALAGFESPPDEP